MLYNLSQQVIYALWAYPKATSSGRGCLLQLGEPFWVHKSIPVALISFVNLLWKDMDEIWGMT